MTQSTRLSILRRKMNREVLDQWCERGILILVLAILVFAPLATGAVDPVPSVIPPGATVGQSVPLAFPIVQAMTLGVMLLWGLRLWINPRLRLLWPPLCWVALAFAAYAVGRYFTADIEYVARAELMRVLVYAVVFLAVMNNLHRQEYSQVIVFVLVGLGMLECSYALYQYVTDSGRVWHFIMPYKNRASGTYINPNHLAGFLELILPLALAYTLVGRIKPVTRVLLGYASLVMLAGVGVTLSRGAWIATAIVLVVFFAVLLTKRSLRLQAALTLVLLLAGAALVLPKSYHLLERVGNGPLEKRVKLERTRYRIWEATVRMWQDNPWWGVGPGHFDYCFRKYRPDLVQARPDHAHNDYLNLLADWGATGAGIIAGGLVLLMAGVFKTWRYVRRDEQDFGTKLTNKFAFVFGASLALLAFLLHALTDFNSHIPANALLAVTLMALLTSYQRFATEQHWSTVRWWHQASLSLLLLAGVVLFGSNVYRRVAEFVWLDRATHQPLFSNEQIQDLKKAFVAEPRNAETAYALGEAFRVQSFEGNSNYAELAGQAMDWYKLGMKLNRHDGYQWLRYGMCLDWLGRQDEAEAYFQRADELDPAGYFTAAHIGWHYVQTGNYAAARTWFERSLRLPVDAEENPIAHNYMAIVLQRLQEAAAPK